MHVAIVDDEQKELDTLQAYLAQYSAENGIKINVDQFHSGDELLKEYRLIYDIIIFDIDMPGTNGIDTARQIREKDDNVGILFITNIAQYAINGYEVEAVDYIIKPIGYFDFALKFRRALNWASRRTDRELTFETVEGNRRVRVADIVYVEARGHYLIHNVQPKNGKAAEFTVRGNMKDQEELLRIYNFCRVHRSFLVNLKYVEEIQNNKVVVGQSLIPIGRLYKGQLMQECLRFVRG